MDIVSYGSLAIALGTLIYQVGFRNGSSDKRADATDKGLAELKAKVDQYSMAALTSQVKTLSENSEKYPLAEISNQVKTLWEVYVVDALHNRSDLASRGSPLEITVKGEAMIPQDIKDMLKNHNPKIDNSHSAGWLVINCLGTDCITALAIKLDLSFAVTMALLAVYYRKLHPECELSELYGVCKPEASKTCEEPKTTG
jgi:ABC-type transporter Mla MlaB component